MKTFKYIGLAGFTLLTVSSLVMANSAIAVEKAKYAGSYCQPTPIYMNSWARPKQKFFK